MRPSKSLCLDDAMTAKGQDLFKPGSHSCCLPHLSPLCPGDFGGKDEMEAYDDSLILLVLAPLSQGPGSSCGPGQDALRP